MADVVIKDDGWEYLKGSHAIRRQNGVYQQPVTIPFETIEDVVAFKESHFEPEINVYAEVYDENDYNIFKELRGWQEADEIEWNRIADIIDLQQIKDIEYRKQRQELRIKEARRILLEAGEI